MLVDDAQLQSVNPLSRYLTKSPSWTYEGVLGYRTTLFRKLDAAPPPFEHFGSDYDRRPTFSYLPLKERPLVWGRQLVFDRSPLRHVVRRVIEGRGRKL